MDQRNRSIIVGAVALLIVAAILGVIFYFGKTYRNQTNTSESDILKSLTQGNRVTPTATVNNNLPTGNTNNLNTKSYLGLGLKVNYPVEWGILTCSNSQNIELDPTNSADVKNVVCDRAVKPVTFLVSDKAFSCPGETIKIGNYQVVKSKEVKSNGDTNYRWCLTLPGGKSLDITHRVSQSGNRATSKDDFSSLVEQVITNLQGTAGS